MDSTRVTVSNNGELVLPAHVQTALGIASGTEVEIVLHNRLIQLVPKREKVPAGEVKRLIAELQDMFRGEPSLEEEYFRTRDKDKW